MTSPRSIADYVRRNAAKARKTLGASHGHGQKETLREAEYKGHRIVIGTTYRVEVDGKPVGGDFIVTDSGEVQCHALPNYTFSSAVDLVKSMIDVFPEDFAGAGTPGEHGAHDHGHHGAPPARTRAKRGQGAARKTRGRRKGTRHGGR